MTIHAPAPNSGAETFRRLHQGFFVLPTIWDVLSAVAAFEAGFPAIATSSASVGFGRGRLPDERLPLADVAAQVAAIVRAVPLPVSVDFEDGYPDDATGEIGESIRRILGAGAAAANIEDSRGHYMPLVPAEHHARIIEQARKAALSSGQDFFINARTDLFLQAPGVEPEQSIAEAVRRARLYVEAGADGIYVTGKGFTDEQIDELARDIPAPLTVLAPPEGRSFAAWPGLGVRRLSLGTLPVRAAYAAVQTQLATLRDGHDVPAITPAADIARAIRAARQAAGAPA